MKVYHFNNLEAGKLDFSTEIIICECILVCVTQKINK